MTLNDILQQLHNVSGNGKQYSAKCPAHDDNHASLSVSAGEKGVVLNCHAGCTVEQITASLGLTASDLFYSSTSNGNNSTASAIEYIYRDMDGKPVAKKIRYPNKAFCWMHINKSGEWEKGNGGRKLPLYHQYECQKCNELYIVEGEKDVDTLHSIKKAAVSLPNGAKSSWCNAYTDYFEGKNIAIIPDNDEPGRKFARMIADKLADIATVRIVDLSLLWEDIPEKADITDYVVQFGADSFKRVSELARETEPIKHKKRLISLANVEATQTQWLWYPYIPKGKITLMTADPGTGKTYFCLYLTATVSTGRPFFGETEGREPGKVIYQTAEDGYADTIVPRLQPMEPNFENVFFADESEKQLEFMDEELESIVKEAKPDLIIFDPLQAYLGMDVDMHRANQVRPIMSKVINIAEKYNVAVIFIMHNSKMGQNQALYRALGTIDIPAAARSMLIMGKDPEDDKQKLLCQEKSSLAPHGKTIMFHIDPSKGGIVFDGFSDYKADDILNPHQKTRNKPSATKDEVKEALLEMLRKGEGSASMDEIESLRVYSGWSKSTLYNAKEELKLQRVQIGYSKNKKTWWLLPNMDVNQFRNTHHVTNDECIDNVEDKPLLP
ncbi:MAG: AAA family ATPase [Clostridia bacterium]|nr:AAA family ATPase [Clostridia bacterium]